MKLNNLLKFLIITLCALVALAFIAAVHFNLINLENYPFITGMIIGIIAVITWEIWKDEN